MEPHRFEIAIVMQERMATLDAEGPDQDIDRFAHRHALAAQEAIVGRRADGQIGAGQRNEIKSAHRLLDLIRLAVRPQPLKNLAKDEIADKQALPPDKPTQRSHLIREVIVEMIHPDRGIDQDHRAFRPSRLSSRLPDQ